MFRCQRKCHRFEPDILLQLLWDVNSVGRVPALHAGCREFESLTSHQIWKCGRVWFIAPVLKTDDQKWSVSSNLTASAKFTRLVKWMITLCYERRSGGSIPSLGAKVLEDGQDGNAADC